MVKKRQFMLPPMLPLLDDCTPKSRLHPQLENGANGQNRLVQADFRQNHTPMPRQTQLTLLLQVQTIANLPTEGFAETSIDLSTF